MAKLISFTHIPRVPRAEKIKAKLPEILHEDVSIEISGIPTPYANAIRRVICAEIPTKILVAHRADISTDDEFIIPDLICDRISQIPIMQDTPEGSKYTLKTSVLGEFNKSIRTGDLVGRKGSMNTNMEILSLRGGCSLELSCHVKTHMGYCTDDTTNIGFVACQVASTPANPDLKLYDQYIQTDVSGDAFDADAPRGIRSGYSNESHYLIKFISLGTMPAEKIVKTACEILSARFAAVANTPITSGREHICSIIGESMTIGPPIIYAGIQLDPSSNITVGLSASISAIEIKFLLGTYTDPARFLGDISSTLSKFFGELAKEF